MEQVCYRYDGSFGGFLTCVYESYVNQEPPGEFLLPEEGMTLWQEREVSTHNAHAKRVYAALSQRVSPAFQKWIERGFLTCLPRREMVLYELIRRGFREGDGVRRDLSDPTVAKLALALRKLATEEDHLKGFVRFSQLDGVLVGEIEPKNRVLPLLAPHFAARFSGEKIVLFDRTHHEAFFYADYRRTILPVEEFHMGPAGAEERTLRELWCRYYQTIAIEGRINPKCQAAHLPKRYRHVMTEFQSDGDTFGPAGKGTKTALEGKMERRKLPKA